jgi:hypothetical protein
MDLQSTVGSVSGLSESLRAHAALSTLYLVSRLALLWAGIRLNFSLDWMWLSDPSDLRERLFETLFYYHAYPPGMDLLTGILLKLGGLHAATLALVLFWFLGLVIVNSLLYLGRAAGLSARVAFGVAIVFALIPQSIYFEHVYLYEYPITALLCLAAVFFERAVRVQSLGAGASAKAAFWLWFGFFLTCAIIGLTRSTFHLVWFIAMTGLGACFIEPHARRVMLKAACIPAALLIGLYAKNVVVFGVFEAYSSGPASYQIVTTWRLPPEIRNTWIREGKLSRFAAVGPDAGPREFLPLFSTSENPEWPAQLNRLDRPTVYAPNFNHWFFLEANIEKRRDALYTVKERPLDYVATVLEGFGDMLSPSTEWHPHDKTGLSPHNEHRQVLGWYEVLYNRVVHSLPVAPFGMYVFLPLVMVGALWRLTPSLRGSARYANGRAALLSFWLLNVAYVVAVSSMFTFRESSRYRYQIEPMIWLTAAISVGLAERREDRDGIRTRMSRV